MSVRALSGTVSWQGDWLDYVWQVNDRLTAAPQHAADDAVCGYIVPGLVDVHAHLGYGTTPEETLANARTTLSTGVTDIRDCGVPDRANAFLQGRTDVPRVIRCGRHIARPKRYIEGMAVEISPGELVDEVARQAADNSWVKLVGDWIDRSEGADSTLRPLWDRRELVDAVAAAHEADARVTVHTFATDTVDDLLIAGVDCIEHGTGMTADQAREAAQRGIAVTPTLLQVELFDTFAAQAGTKYPVYRDLMHGMYERRREHFSMLLDSGIQLLPGTDAGGYQAHGQLPRELTLWQEWGMAPERIIEAATVDARYFLGIASMGAGAPATYVVYSEDPRTDVRVLAHPVLVVRDGIDVWSQPPGQQ